MNKPITDCVLVSADFSNGKDVGVMIVGRRRKSGRVDIVNAFQGDEAMDIYQKLITPNTQNKPSL